MNAEARGAKRGSPRILVVEDDPAMRDLVQAVLHNKGYLVEGAGDGLEALVRLQRGKFDVVVTDFEMPRLDGLALLREIGRMEIPLPVIVFTGHTDASTESSLRQAGAFRVLKKGDHLQDLARWVGKAYGGSRDAYARLCVSTGAEKR